MEQQMRNVLESKMWPYKSAGDIVRHAVLRHLLWLEQQYPIKSVTAQVQAINTVMREDEFQQEFEETFNKLDSQIRTLIGRGRETQAKTLVTRVWLMLQDMPEGEWKHNYVDEMKKRFGSMVEFEEVSLTVFGEGD